MKSLHRWGKRLAALGLIAFLGACEFIVSSDPGEVGCPQGNEGIVGPPVCPEQQVCHDTRCVPCDETLCRVASAGGTGQGTSADQGGQGGGAGHK